MKGGIKEEGKHRKGDVDRGWVNRTQVPSAPFRLHIENNKKREERKGLVEGRGGGWEERKRGCPLNAFCYQGPPPQSDSHEISSWR